MNNHDLGGGNGGKVSTQYTGMPSLFNYAFFKGGCRFDKTDLARKDLHIFLEMFIRSYSSYG